MIIISIIIFLSVFFLLKDLHIEVYNNRHRCVKIDEYKFKYRIWHIIVILLFSFIPIINIIAFIGFLIYYIVHCLWDPYYCDDVTHVFKPKCTTKVFKFISLLISKVLNFLNKEI